MPEIRSKKVNGKEKKYVVYSMEESYKNEQWHKNKADLRVILGMIGLNYALKYLTSDLHPNVRFYSILGACIGYHFYSEYRLRRVRFPYKFLVETITLSEHGHLTFNLFSGGRRG